jgi:hypothetical protein
MMLWMHLGLCIPNIGYNQIVRCLSQNTFHVIKTTLFSRFWRDGEEIFVYKVLNASNLDNQQSMFKLTMKSNLVACKFPMYVKLAKLVMVQIVNNLENQKYFFTLGLTKSKLYNKFTTHLPHVMCRFA